MPTQVSTQQEIVPILFFQGSRQRGGGGRGVTKTIAKKVGAGKGHFIDSRRNHCAPVFVSF